MKTDLEREAFIQRIEQLPSELSALVSSLTAEQLTTPYLAGEWTAAQNVHHLADSHMNSFIRCKLILTEDNPTLKPYNQDIWAAEADARGADISDSLSLLRGLHARWTIFWRSLPAEAWIRPGYHPEVGPVTLEMQLEIYANHGVGHIDQIRRTLKAGA